MNAKNEGSAGRATKLKVYAVTHEGMTTYFSQKRNAQRFNALHEERAEIETHVFDAAGLADMLNSPLSSANTEQSK